MNLLIVFHSLYSAAGGVDNRISQLEIELSKNFNTHFLLFKNEIDLPLKGEISFINSLKIPPLIVKNKYKFRLFAYLYGFIILINRIIKTRKFIKSKKFDTILAVDDYFSIITLFSTVGLNKKIICSARNNWNIFYNDSNMIHLLPNFMYKWILPKLMNKYASNVHCVSEELSSMLKEEYKIKNTITIYNIFDMEKIKNQANENIEIKEPFFINIGHFNKQKNQKDLILVYKYLYDNYKVKEKLVFIGNGIFFKDCINLSQRLNLEKNVIFLGQQKNPYKYLKKAKLYISTSLYEGLPAVFIESLILNIPIVSYDFQTGAKELCDNLTQMDYIELAKKVQETINNQIIIDTSIKKGNIILKNKFDKKIILDKWLEIL